jgi:hypothetical protein
MRGSTHGFSLGIVTWKIKKNDCVNVSEGNFERKITKFVTLKQTHTQSQITWLRERERERERGRESGIHIKSEWEIEK